MVVICYGTRPEVIKLAPVINSLNANNLPYKTVFTGQHKDLFEDVKSLVPPPDYTLNLLDHGKFINGLIAHILAELQPILIKERTKLLVVQGDTSSVLASALCAFNIRIAIGHVEAGLRTYDINSPFPEEANRQMVSSIASINWAPTQLAFDNLKKIGLGNIILTGNTIIDSCLAFNLKSIYSEKVLITLHRRENQGLRMKYMFKQLDTLATIHTNIEFIFPMHPNPNIQKYRYLLKNVTVIPLYPISI